MGYLWLVDYCIGLVEFDVHESNEWHCPVESPLERPPARVVIVGGCLLIYGKLDMVCNGILLVIIWTFSVSEMVWLLVGVPLY